MKKTIALLTVVIMMVSVAVAQPGKHHPPKDGMKPKHERLAFLPDLTEEQKESIKSIHLNAKKQMLPLKNQMGEKKARMKTLTTSEEVDMAKVDALIDEMSSIKAEMMKIRVRSKQEVRAQLTEEQRIIFDTMKHKRHHKGMRPHHGRRM
jgi:Spy/CpxP family protein refolding chaperone